MKLVTVKNTDTQEVKRITRGDLAMLELNGINLICVPKKLYKRQQRDKNRVRRRGDRFVNPFGSKLVQRLEKKYGKKSIA
ncbi:hypothetical protein AB832_07895 [Flavobacteriaceae bacterium (ex Bugula neritina AB1)]|nr:hypothetical protein AB832_07895 [Flavobacteriaceae bacterium (ex Bugula neritina AB1)]